MNVTGFTAGQTAYIVTEDKRRSGEPIEEATVAKVGRKYVTIADHNETKFAETLDSVPYLIEAADRGYKRMLFPSRQAAEDHKERGEILRWLRTRFQWGTEREYTLEQLRQIKEILER